MKVFEAVKENLNGVNEFVEESLNKLSCDIKTRMQIMIAVEEVFVNIANYAYESGSGDVSVDIAVSESPETIEIKFTDEGIAYNPLEKEDPDIHSDVDSRPIGGLGIFMTKQIMDEITYENIDGKNVLTLKKKTEREV